MLIHRAAFVLLVLSVVSPSAWSQLDAREASFFQSLAAADARIGATIKLIQEEYYWATDIHTIENACITGAMSSGSQERRPQADACLASMVHNLDAQSTFINSEEFQKLAKVPALAGIGLELGKVDGGSLVVSTIKDGPAERAGVRRGDLLTSIDGRATAALTLPDIVAALRGKDGTPVALQLMREPDREPLRLEVVRSPITVSRVKSLMLRNGVGYVKLRQFSDRTAIELAQVGRRFLTLPSKPARGLVIDLRDCPGGLLKGAVALAAAFLPDEAIVLSLDARKPSARTTFRAIAPDTTRDSKVPNPLFEDRALRTALQNAPLAVLVNHGTSSGAEVAAAALQESQRAVVFGVATAGVTDVQTIFPLEGNDSGVKLITARMRTPSGKSLFRDGLKPNIVLDLAVAAETGRGVEEDAWVQYAANWIIRTNHQR